MKVKSSNKTIKHRDYHIVTYRQFPEIAKERESHLIKNY